MGNWAWSWEALAAIGQVIAAILTVVAVWIALRQLIFQSKSKALLRMQHDIIPIDKNKYKSIFGIYITNVGILPMVIDQVGFFYGGKYYRTNEDIFVIPGDNSIKLPIKLDPTQTIKVCAEPKSFFNVLKHTQRGKNDNNAIYLYFSTMSGHAKKKKLMRLRRFINEYEELRVDEVE